MKTLISAIALSALLTTVASAASVDARLSSREAYVGSPVVLQLSISNAADYEQPKIPQIDGCDIRSAGSPSQSSQITIINGRRSESRSVTMQYLITPRREGSFTVPALTVKVDGKQVSTEPLRFVATKSETGDLLFAEIEGGKQKVFVGEPLDMKLKVWIKPYRDAESGLTLSEGDMWNMISDSTAWGGFSDRVQELAENNQRPGGQEVLRDDGTGNERSYYLYEINATVYPKRAGKIDADDVQIVVNYPTALGRSRSPFDDFFSDSPFGGRSPISRMMNDDLFGSPFGDRLSVTQSRPIVGEVSVDSTNVLPVPTEGRPDDYRGAVGSYQIVTRATPITVDAGDPITLDIGIKGTGPMELVQAPPLFELPELTKDFKVADESLAGFVQDDTKLFSTTIRPRREGITEIPGIRFSFFNPETEKYQTVTSEPITITVNKSETLALDAIVGHTRKTDRNLSEAPIAESLPDLKNHNDASLLFSQLRQDQAYWWWAFLLAPPLVWIGAILATYRMAIYNRLPSFKSAKTRCLQGIDNAPDRNEISKSLTTFIFRRCRRRPSQDMDFGDDQGLSSNATEAVGVLRIAGLYQVAGEVESFLSKSYANDHELHETSVARAKVLIEEIDTALQDKQKTRVKPSKPRSKKPALQRSLGAMLVIALLTFSGSVSAAETVDLSAMQQQRLLVEAGEAYSQGLLKSETDSADAKELFTTAIQKYQLLVESGIQNADLYVNLGNAYLQTGQLGYAIANYEKAKQLDAGNAQAIQNLKFAYSKVELPQAKSSVSVGYLRAANDAMIDFIGGRTLFLVFAVSSVLYWGVLTLRLLLPTLSTWKWATAPLLILLLSMTSFALTQSNPQPSWNAVIVADTASLHAADGDQFDEVVTLADAQGHRVELITSRGEWSQIKTADDHIGWVRSDAIEFVKTSS